MPKKILVVDDDVLILGLLSDMLEDLGCAVVAIHEPCIALDVLTGTPDIAALITDVNMPTISGTDLARRAQELRPGLHVLLVSGRPQREPGYPILPKPFSLHDLARVMESTIGRC